MSSPRPIRPSWSLPQRRTAGSCSAGRRCTQAHYPTCPAHVDLLIENALSDAGRLFHVVLAFGLLDNPVTVPWWNGMRSRLTA
jgi:hypothetical protein